jgi:hypothetical protein
MLFIVIAVAWWIGMWGLSDLLTEDYTREQKFTYYISLLAVVSLMFVVFPKSIDRL